MVNPLSAMVWPQERFWIIQIWQLYTNKDITYDKLHMLQQIDQRKKSKSVTKFG